MRRMGLGSVYRSGRERGNGPAFFADFTAGKLPSGQTLSRGTNATMFDSQGRLVWAPANLLADSRFNFGVTWSLSAATATPAGDGALGGTTAKLLITNNGQSTIGNDGNGCTNTSPAITTAVGQPHMLSFYAKATAEVSAVRVRESAATGARAYINLLTGAITAENGIVNSPVGGMLVAAALQPSGWWLITVSRIASNTSINYSIKPGLDVGDGVSGVLLSCSQLEWLGIDSPKPYVETTGTAYYGPRFDYAPDTLSALGLLIEEARTNLVVNNTDPAAWSLTNFTGSAGGTLRGWASRRLTAIDSVGSSCNAHSGAMLGTLAATTNHAQSVLVKLPAGSTARYVQVIVTTGWGGPDAYGNFDLVAGVVGTLGSDSVSSSMQDIGDGIYRLTVVSASNAAPGANTATVVVALSDSNTASRLPVIPLTTAMKLDVALAQLEVGSFATSIIPTFGTAATRAAETCTGAAPWYNTNAGTMVLHWEAMPKLQGRSPMGVSLDDNGAGNRWFIIASDTALTANNDVASVGNGSASVAVSVAAGATYRMATRMLANSFRGAVAGALGILDPTGAVSPGINTLRFGGSASGALSAVLNGHIHSFKYYNFAMTDAQLIEAST